MLILEHKQLTINVWLNLCTLSVGFKDKNFYDVYDVLALTNIIL